jgi:putative aldouronate transport system permease protein
MSDKMNAKKPALAIKDTTGDKVFHTITYILLGLLALIILYPVYFIVIASISDPDAVLAGKVVLLPVGINFDGYMKILERTDV